MEIVSTGKFVLGCSKETAEDIETKVIEALAEEFKPKEGDTISEIAVGDKVFYNVCVTRLEEIIRENLHIAYSK